MYENLSMRYSDSKIKDLIENLIATFILRLYHQKSKAVSKNNQEEENAQTIPQNNSLDQLKIFQVEEMDCAFEILDRFSKKDSDPILLSSPLSTDQQIETSQPAISTSSNTIPSSSLQNQEQINSKNPTKKRKETLKKKKKKLNNIMVNYFFLVTLFLFNFEKENSK